MLWLLWPVLRPERERVHFVFSFTSQLMIQWNRAVPTDVHLEPCAWVGSQKGIIGPSTEQEQQLGRWCDAFPNTHLCVDRQFTVLLLQSFVVEDETRLWKMWNCVPAELFHWAVSDTTCWHNFLKVAADSWRRCMFWVVTLRFWLLRKFLELNECKPKAHWIPPRQTPTERTESVESVVYLSLEGAENNKSCAFVT